MLAVHTPSSAILPVPALCLMMPDGTARLASERRNPTSGPPCLLSDRGAAWVCGDSVTKSEQMLKPGQWRSAPSFIAEALPDEVAALIAVLKEASEKFQSISYISYKIEKSQSGIFYGASKSCKTMPLTETVNKDQDELEKCKKIYKKYIEAIDTIIIKISDGFLSGNYIARRTSHDGYIIETSAAFMRNCKLIFDSVSRKNLLSGHYKPDDLFIESFLMLKGHDGRLIGGKLPLSHFDFCLSSTDISPKSKWHRGRPSKHDWAKAAAIMAAYMAEHGEPGAERGDMSRAAEHLLERMGKNAPSDSVAREFIASIRDEYGRIKGR